MAYCPTEDKYGYEISRFQKDVDENLHCSICYNVLKEPRTCRNNEHVFCLSCISEHLRVNSQTCPECNEHLSVDTLRRPRVLNNILSKLKINCEYASRGCSEFICVQDLKTHVAKCGFAAVLCSNEQCGMVINKQDKVHHETEVCRYRKVKCYDCGQIQEDVKTLKGCLMELDGKVEAVENKVENNHVEMKKIVGKLEALKDCHDAMKRDQREVRNEVKEVRKEVKDVNENLSKVNQDVDEVKLMMSQMLEKFSAVELMNKLPCPTEGMYMLKTPREDILIAGNGAEIFCWKMNGWYKVLKMNQIHIGASSFIYNDQLFVASGGTKTIETMDLTELPLKWMQSRRELPYGGYGHRTALYQQRVIHIGGYNLEERKMSDLISELQLTSPCRMKELCQMPEPRMFHGAEVFENKVLILGGKADGLALDSVLEFDPEKNECNEIPSLPHPLLGMTTVRWRDQVVVLGGRGEDDEVRNDVFMYDSKTGKTTTLPSMLEKRYFCCAVITGNTIVIMGGRNEDLDDLSSVECLTIGGCTWKCLPSMNEKRSWAVAEVLSSTRKYV